MKYLEFNLLFAAVMILSFGPGVDGKEATGKVTSKGKKLYAQGDYAGARDYFAARIKVDPKNATEHYFLANSLLKLQKNEDAIKEYRQAQSLDPDGPVGEYSKRALAILSNPPAPAVETRKLTSSQLSSSQSVKSGQADQQKAAIIAEGNARVAKIKQEADEQVASLTKDEKESLIDLNSFGNARGSRTSAGNYNTGVQSEYDDRIKAIRANAQRRIDETLKFYKQKAAAYD